MAKRSDGLELNGELVVVGERVCADLESLVAERDLSAAILLAFLTKAVKTVRGMVLLCETDLWEQAQVLLRVVLETRINFDCYVKLCETDTAAASQRVLDAIALDKQKQQRASNYLGREVIEGFDPEEYYARVERELVERYGADEVKQMRKNGFTGMSVELRAKDVGLESRYQVVYRNFSRNVHSTDIMEHILKQVTELPEELEDYTDLRDSITLGTASFCLGGMLEEVNRGFRLGHDDKIGELGDRDLQLWPREPESSEDP